MKKLLFTLIALLMLQGAVKASDDKPIKIGELPAVAQTFIKKFFPAAKVALATVDNELLDKDYKVEFVNGAKVKFDKNGVWKEVDCNGKLIPKGIIPPAIQSKIDQTYGVGKITKIEKDKGGFEVKLIGGKALKFNKKMELVEIDD